MNILSIDTTTKVASVAISNNGKIIDIGDCMGCTKANNTDPNINPGKVIRTKNFDISQDFELPINGFIVIGSICHGESRYFPGVRHRWSRCRHTGSDSGRRTVSRSTGFRLPSMTRHPGTCGCSHSHDIN